jgi:hypothetical protein
VRRDRHSTRPGRTPTQPNCRARCPSATRTHLDELQRVLTRDRQPKLGATGPARAVAAVTGKPRIRWLTSSADAGMADISRLLSAVWSRSAFEAVVHAGDRRVSAGGGRPVDCAGCAGGHRPVPVAVGPVPRRTGHARFHGHKPETASALPRAIGRWIEAKSLGVVRVFGDDDCSLRAASFEENQAPIYRHQDTEPKPQTTQNSGGRIVSAPPAWREPIEQKQYGYKET